MTAALRLADLGVEVVLAEAAPEPMTDWRASTFHGATLEVLEPTGVVADMHRLGLIARTFQLRDRHEGLVASFDFSVLAEETRYPYRLQLNQQRLVGLLHDRLLTHPRVQLCFGTRLTGLEEDNDGVVAALEGPGGPEEVRAAFLVGADGASSTVRRELDIGFSGTTYRERFLIVSVAEDLGESLPDLAYVNYVADPVEWLFILRTPESWRVLFPVPEDESDDEALGDEAIERRLQAVAPLPQPYRVLDRQLYKVHQRVADRFSSARALLMGDAAHVNSPIGGVGLNSGIHDASDAAVRLARVLTEGSDAGEELAAYATLRRTVALEYVQRDTHANTMRLAERDRERRARELAAMAELPRQPEQMMAYLRRVSLLEPLRRYGIGRPPVELAEASGR